jgi:hypothetical protein
VALTLGDVSLGFRQMPFDQSYIHAQNLATGAGIRIDLSQRRLSSDPDKGGKWWGLSGALLLVGRYNIAASTPTLS